MSSISPAELYTEMRADPAMIERLYHTKNTNDMAALVHEFAAAKGHSMEMSEIFSGIWDAQNIVKGVIAEDAMNDNEAKLATEGMIFVRMPVGDELTDDELEMVSAGGGSISCDAPDGCPENSQKSH